MLLFLRSKSGKMLYPEGLSFRGTNAKNYLAVKLDVTKKEDIESAFQKALSQFGRVDVVVNNAGYGLSGPFEELDEPHVRMQMEVNFFGLIAVTKKSMEVVREQKPSGGLIQQITSIGGQRGWRIRASPSYRNVADPLPGFQPSAFIMLPSGRWRASQKLYPKK
ncbi:MAG: hypothetical protein LQ342_004207 [Letrouitia transgressa]|nr:MAG: hypothetical protein LQ342_004207 [Letrouitia transgressa]